MSSEVHKVFEGFLTTIGMMAANKKVVGGWLVLLTMSLGAVADKVYVERTAELAVLETKLDSVQTTVNEIKATTKENSVMLQQLLVEQTRVRAELEAHERATAAKR